MVKTLEQRVPTIDDQPEALPTDYKDWRSEDTRVLVFTDDPALYPRDLPAHDLEDARARATHHGRILEVNQVPHRWFIRIPRA